MPRKPTWDEALADPAIPLHWLCKITIGGVAHHFAERDQDTGGILWQGTMRIDRAPENDVDPFAGRYSEMTCAVSIAPRAADAWSGNVAEFPWYSADVIGADFSLYLWPLGADISEAHEIHWGTVTDAPLRDGRFSLAVGSGLTRYDGGLLAQAVTKKLWPLSDKDARGQFLPIPYGVVNEVPFPVINLTSNYLGAAAYEIEDVVTLWVDGVSKTISAQGIQTDSNGRSFWRVTTSFDLTEDTGECVGLVHGVIDDALGTWSGAASTRIDHPAHQLHHLVGLVAGIPAARINSGTFFGAAAALPGVAFGTLVSGESQQSLLDVAADVLAWLRCAIYDEGGRVCMGFIDLSGGASHAIKDGDQGFEFEGVELQGLDDIENVVSLKYSWRWNKRKSRWKFAEKLTLDAADYAPLALSQSKYGRREPEGGPMECKHVHDDDTAERCASLRGELRSKPRATATVLIGRAGHRMMMLDKVALTTTRYPSRDGAGCVSKEWVVIGREVKRNAVRLKLLEV